MLEDESLSSYGTVTPNVEEGEDFFPITVDAFSRSSSSASEYLSASDSDDDLDAEESSPQMAQDGNWKKNSKAKKGLRATRKRLSVGSFPNLLKETTELDLDYKEISIHELDLEDEPIARGAFGVIYKGYWRGAKIAVKQLHISCMGEREIYEFRHEAAMMKLLGNHPNVVDFIGACTTPPHFCLVSPFYQNGSVRDYITKHKDLPWMTLVRFARDAAAGVLHLHCEHVVHRDIAARNLLVDDNLNVRVSDFGLARRMYDKCKTNEASVLPVGYMAPESIRRREYSIKSDSFSFGVFLWELVTKDHPYRGMALLDVAFGVTIEGLRLKIPQNCPTEFTSLMGKCWLADPSDRPDFYELFLTLEEYLETLEKLAEDEKKKKEINRRRRTHLQPDRVMMHSDGHKELPQRHLQMRVRSSPMLGSLNLINIPPLRMSKTQAHIETSYNTLQLNQTLEVDTIRKGGSESGEYGRDATTNNEESIQQEKKEEKEQDITITVTTTSDTGSRQELLVGYESEKAASMVNCLIDPDSIEDLCPVENSSHSLICKATYLSGKGVIKVAVKRLCHLHHPQYLYRDTLQQAELLRSLQDCSNIIRFLGISLSPENMFLVFPWAKNGSLARLMTTLSRRWKHLRKEKPLLLVRMAHDIAIALLHLHSKNIVHCNLNPTNILLDEQYRAQLCGFSLARSLDKETQYQHDALTSTGEATHFAENETYYCPPEILNMAMKRPSSLHRRKVDYELSHSDDHHSRNSKPEEKGPLRLIEKGGDVYSFGVILRVLWTGLHNNHKKKRMHLKALFLKGEQLPMPKGMPNDWFNLMDQCMSLDPSKRPSFEVIVPALKNIWQNWKHSLGSTQGIPTSSSNHTSSSSNLAVSPRRMDSTLGVLNSPTISRIIHMSMEEEGGYKGWSPRGEVEADRLLSTVESRELKREL